MRTAAISILAAIVISCASWFMGLLPLVRIPAAGLWLWRTLDIVPSAFALVLPVEWRSGFHQYFNGMTYCFPGTYWWETTRYLRTAIPAYALAFAVVIMLARFCSTALRSPGSEPETS